MNKLLTENKISAIILVLVLMVALVIVACNNGITSEDNVPQDNETTAAYVAETSSSDATTASSESAETSNQDSANTETTTESPSPSTELVLLDPVETNPANTSYQPAFAGQTRAPGTVTKTDYDVTILSEELQNPWAVTALPDGRLIITEKAGYVHIWSADGQSNDLSSGQSSGQSNNHLYDLSSGRLSDQIGGFPAVDSRSQGGLLDVAPAPDFLTSRMLYFTLAEATAQGSLTAVGRGRLAEDESRIEDFEIIWRAVPYFDNSMHFGSRLAFDQDGNILVTTGERSDLRTRLNAQLLDTGHGKVVKITPDGKPAPGNPFAGIDGVLPEIYTYGHRNVQGLAIEPATGNIWISEMGPRGGDELNLIEAGGNYGWPVISYGIEYSGDPIPGGLTAQDGMEQPVYYWDPSLAPSGMTFYTSDRIPEWQGNLFVGGLVSKHIARIVLEDGRVIAEERLLTGEDQRFRDVGEGPDGALYAVTDGGRLYRIG